MRPFRRALIALVFVIVPAARAMADEPMPIKVAEQPLLLAGKMAASSVLQVLAFLNVSIGVPVACVVQGIADQSPSGCSAGAAKAWAGSELALCEGGRIGIDAVTFGHETWTCQGSSSRE
ncbi:MAG TPA: hypothetical protein VMS22_25395 [Candidatus Eisenbacteria bacterium]|nr:hypothetical protein [Candidatus Eisenbacteria bacterium]